MTDVMMRGGDHGSLLLAVGHAYNEWLADTDRVTVCVTGKSAVHSGAFDEAVDMAVRWQLLLVFIVEVEAGGEAVDDRVQAAVRRARAHGASVSVYPKPGSPVRLVEQPLAHRLGDRGGAVTDAELFV
ncbi:hypothetical protein A5725_02465 [Mycobacterium kubicae]|uniref:hypothetical protein n=1 Tax=Mycobacterium kubicae TaxID=120959 RepID=UPI0008018CC1|nr:hypothetical protein [Mycobacterium kubicae]OBF18860.1 hypothetical protein A5725_02465 [Mycobacterium kubicae]